ncbi:MBL fold metallo-hydrolase [Acidicapsa ligni]|uniref:MBL fold metallo-hydrolase n=1 Tax=Acidicapsa ligni TaxID=542300 RepID=UPI0021E0139E|nr:MBL fold metallo-hydrolase [Acidicapsa ligni]
MENVKVRIMLIDGPTLFIEYAGLRLLTDPTFDPPQLYPLGGENLRKYNSPPVTPESLLPIDAVLLSHDHHMDNLDQAGRAFLPSAGRVITTASGAKRLGGETIGLHPWETTTIPLPNGGKLTITATPARHGPIGIEPIIGDVVGFVLSTEGHRDIYITGDTVWFEGLEPVAQRFNVGLAVLYAGAAQPRGPFNVTMNSNDALEAASRFKDAKITSVHNYGWSHFIQSPQELETAFKFVGNDRLITLKPAVPVDLTI